MDNLKLKAYAKINLAIDLLGKRADGYNEVKMIMQTPLFRTLIMRNHIKLIRLTFLQIPKDIFKTMISVCLLLDKGQVWQPMPWSMILVPRHALMLIPKQKN